MFDKSLMALTLKDITVFELEAKTCKSYWTRQIMSGNVFLIPENL